MGCVEQANLILLYNAYVQAPILKHHIFISTVYPVIHPSPPSKITKLEDEHVDISCEASGSPVPNVSWYKNSQHGWKKLSGRRLQIKKLKLSDSGLYKCLAMNFMGSQKKTVKMVVYGT